MADIDKLRREISSIRSEFREILTMMKSGQVSDQLELIGGKLDHLAQSTKRLNELSKETGKIGKEASDLKKEIAKEELDVQRAIEEAYKSQTKELGKTVIEARHRARIDKERAALDAKVLQNRGKYSKEEVAGAEAGTLKRGKELGSAITDALKDIGSAAGGGTKGAASLLGAGSADMMSKGIRTFSAALKGVGGALGATTGVLGILGAVTLHALKKNAELMADRLNDGALAVRAMGTKDMINVGQNYQKWVYSAALQHAAEVDAIKAVVNTLGSKYKFNLEDFMKSNDELGFTFANVRRTAAGLGMKEEDVAGVLDTLVNTYRTNISSAKAQQQAAKALNTITAYAIRADKEGIMSRGQFTKQVQDAIQSTNQYHVSASGVANLMDSFARITGRSRVAQDQLANMTSQAVSGMRGMNDSLALLAMPDKGLGALWEFPTLDPDEMQRRVTGMFGGMMKMTDAMSSSEKGLKLLVSSGITGLNRDISRRLFMASGRGIGAQDERTALEETRAGVDAMKDLYGITGKILKSVESMKKSIDVGLSNVVQKVGNW